MANSSYVFKLSLLWFLLTMAGSSLLVHGRGGLPLLAQEKGERVREFPPSCNRIECPGYDVIDDGDGFEIRRYNSTVWMFTSPIQDISFTEATRTGFLQLFDYIQGKNDAKKKIEMTAPVLTKVSPSDGPFCESSFLVSFYVPQLNQPDPPSAKGLEAQKWGLTFAAVRQFGGFVSDSNVGKEAAALRASLTWSKWSTVIDRSRGAASKSGYIVAQYNSPFEFDNRVNEIWLNFSMEKENVM